MVGRWKILIATLFLFTAMGQAQDVRLNAKSETTTLPFGSWFEIHVEGTLSENVVSITPAVKDSIGPFELVSVERDGTNPHWIVRVTSIDSGRVFLPPIEFHYKLNGDTNTHKAYTNSLLFSLTGVQVDAKGEIKDIKPPMSAPWLFEDYLPYLIALVILGALGGAYYYYRKKKKLAQDLLADVKVVIPPHREALTALRVLEEKKLWQQGLVKEYYSETTEIIRRFFERRWNIIALELTTDEILAQMKHMPEALMVWKELEAFFGTADLVKFAKSQPSPTDHENEMRIAYDIVRAMVPKTPESEEQQPQEVTANVG